MSEMTAAERIRKSIEARNERVIVDVTVPSGDVYQFEKPSKLSMLFGLGELPQFAASEAVGKWTADGIIKSIEEGDTDVIKIAQTAFTIRDKVLALSYSPKLVIGKADESKDELSTDLIPDEDLTYLFRWVQAGGDVSLMLNTFPEQPQQHALASSSRKGRGAKTK